MLDHPHYTKPIEVDGMGVPQVLTSGNHQDIQRWRRKQALGMTSLKRPDLIKNESSEEDDRLLQEFVAEIQVKERVKRSTTLQLNK